jgi:hypothetical protein
MCDVRKYAPNQTVNWPRCAHGEFCVMQVYQDGTTQVAASGIAHEHG